MKQQGTSKNEVTWVEEEVHEGWKLVQRLQQFHGRLIPRGIY